MFFLITVTTDEDMIVVASGELLEKTLVDVRNADSAVNMLIKRVIAFNHSLVSAFLLHILVFHSSIQI